MEIITPVGSKLLVIPVELKKYLTEGKIQVETIDLRAAKIVEVGTELKDVYKEGEVVIYPKGLGVGQMYRGKAHFWLDGRPVNAGGDVWGTISNDDVTKDKGDNL